MMLFNAVSSGRNAVTHSVLRLAPARAQRLGVLPLLLAISLLTTSCGTVAQAAGSKSVVTPNNLTLVGNLPSGTVNESYNAVLAVGGGRFPYHFSVKTGDLPPGIGLNPATGTFSGKPTTAGKYSFEVIVTDSPNLDQGNKVFALNVTDGGSTGGGGGVVAVSVSPATTALSSTQKQQFTAAVSGTSNTAVTWKATAGAVNKSGLFTAPKVSVRTNVTVTATSTADASKSTSAAVTVNPANNQALQITTSNLPDGQQGNTYSAAFAATGGVTPYSWSVSGGAAPPGITLNANGNFTGLPSASGTFSFTVTASDSGAKTTSSNFTVAVSAGSNFDGPAELPRVTVPSSMADTPAPGSLISVNNGDDLQAALNKAACGDTVQLQAGATFTGKFTLPANNCDNNHWIIIRTNSPDSALPPEGQRATPCYAGVASLPGRPQYNCPNPKNVMARIQVQTQGDGPLLMANGANFYRIIGLEITRPAGAEGSARLISSARTNGLFVADHLVIDRSWLHGATQGEARNGISLDGMTNVAIVDSYFNDFHCVSGVGTCTDAHAVSGGNSKTQDGPYKIQDNFLEAAGEAILFGGGPATSSPADIQILNNHFWKPWQWMPGNPNFVGGPGGHPFVVKNHLELKNAVRVLIEANLMENNWGGFSQSGYGILLTPRNQPTRGGKGPFVCPLCQVTDVTIRYVHISHAGGGIQMATAEDLPNGKRGQPALAGARWSIHDVVLDDLSQKYVGGGTAFEIVNGWAKNPLNTITINHVTAIPDADRHMMIIGNPKGNEPMYGLVFTNNLVITGQYPIWNADRGGDCAESDVPLTTFSKCFSTYTFSNNGLVTPPPAFPPPTWPAHNMFPDSIADVQFMTFNNGDDGNYQLQSASPYKNKGTDGRDLGADIVGLNAALANIE